MRIRVQYTRINSVPSVILYTEAWDRRDLDDIVRFGEPKVEIGGRFEKFPCPPPGPGGCIDDRILEFRLRRFFEALSGATPDNSRTSDALQRWLLDLKASSQGSPDGDPTDSTDSTDSTDYCQGYSDEEDYFTVPCAEKGIRSGFPVLVEFPKEVFADPERAAKLWADEVSSRIAMEVKGLRCLGSMFQKEETYEI